MNLRRMNLHLSIWLLQHLPYLLSLLHLLLLLLQLLIKLTYDLLATLMLQAARNRLVLPQGTLNRVFLVWLHEGNVIISMWSLLLWVSKSHEWWPSSPSSATGSTNLMLVLMILMTVSGRSTRPSSRPMRYLNR